MDLVELAKVENELRNILSADAQNPISWDQLGVNLRSQGKLSEAEACFRTALKLDPTKAEHWTHLGQCLSDQQRWADATDCFRRSLSIYPRSAQTASDLAVALLNQGQLAEAAKYAFDAVIGGGNNARFLANYGAILFAQREMIPAAGYFRQAADLEPTNAALWCNLGTAEQALGNLSAARQALEHSLQLSPDQPGALTNYAAVLSQMGKPQEAKVVLERVLSRTPGFGPAWVGLGTALRLLDEFGQASLAFRRAQQIAPRQFEVRYNLAEILALRWELAEAEALVRAILLEQPNCSEAWSLLAFILDKQIRREESLDALKKSLALHPNPGTHRELLRQSQYAADVTAERLLHIHKEWDAAYAAKVISLLPPQRKADDAQRPIRLGFVSGDFFKSPIGFLACRALEYLDKSQCSVACYSDVVREDAFTRRFQATADIWRPTAGLNDAQLARQIEQDQIDVLVDLAGHAGSRLLAFAHNPAPCQISWLGYVGTTGLKGMNYVLADRIHVRAGEEQNFVEQVLRMPHAYACYEPPDYAPEIKPLPALSSGHVVFGCFNNSAKLNPPLLTLWAEILRRVPTARLLLKFGALGQAHVRDRAIAIFTQAGIDASRVQCEGWSAHRELLESYSRVDIALDTQPYSGGLTTCESLWMGMPVITFPGKTFAGRHATSYLTNAGLGQFVAENEEGYVELAVEWAGRIAELAARRATMREQMRNSPVCDASQFARDFLRVVRHAFEAKNSG